MFFSRLASYASRPSSHNHFLSTRASTFGGIVRPICFDAGGEATGDDRDRDHYPGDVLRLLRIGWDCNSKQYHHKQD
jgi:hypothetical protein